MTHRKYSRSRKAIHKAMARNPGQRLPQWMRILQAKAAKKMRMGIDHALPCSERTERIVANTDKSGKTTLLPDKTIKKSPGFMRRMFNRKTGS